MINYNNGKIYKIEPIVEHEEHEIYIGSTTKDKLCQRMATHRRDYKLWKENKCGRCMSYELFNRYGLDNCQIILVELVNANSKDELLSRESHYIKNLKCINKQLSIQTDEERNEYLKNYKTINKDIISERCKKYREEHQDQIKKYRADHKKELSEKKKEWYIKNKEKVLDHVKEYRDSNIDAILERRRELYTLNKDKFKDKYDAKSNKYLCSCGSEIRTGEKTRHEKTLKHQDYLKSL